MNKEAKIAIIGGGVAGTTAALHLSQFHCDITLFEQEPHLISGPPFCHLHAGGNLYREISDQQCLTLLEQSIDFLRYYPFIVDYRPTVIVVPKDDDGSADDLIPRLNLLQKRYQELIEIDPHNKVLGEVDNYYKLYSKEKLLELKNKPPVHDPKTTDEWMIPVAKEIDFEKVQFPLILVQEYGLNLFRLAGASELMIQEIPNITLKTQTKVINISQEDNLWKIETQTDQTTHIQNFDYIINAAGFQTGKIDDMLQLTCNRLVEFKAAYIASWKEDLYEKWPEIIFHGKRGTPKGMGQFTPYPGHHFQLHAMTKDITLYENGLSKNPKTSCQPQLQKDFLKKIQQSWEQKEIEERTKKAINHLAQFIPTFSSATVGSLPLYGAQQIPGDDPDLRVAEVSFPLKYYARCEIVKVSSAIDMADAIAHDLINLQLIDSQREQKTIKLPQEDAIAKKALEVALSRGYEADLSKRTTPKQWL